MASWLAKRNVVLSVWGKTVKYITTLMFNYRFVQKYWNIVHKLINTGTIIKFSFFSWMLAKNGKTDWCLYVCFIADGKVTVSKPSDWVQVFLLSMHHCWSLNFIYTCSSYTFLSIKWIIVRIALFLQTLN